MTKNHLLLILLLSLFTFSGFAQKNVKTKANYTGTVSSVEYVSSLQSRPGDLRAPDNTPREAKDKRSIGQYIGAGQDPQTQDDYFVRNKHEMEQSVRMTPPSLVFDTYSSTSQPTDPSLAVGPNHVMVVFNTGFMIYDKSGNILLGETSPNPAIFPAGGCCDLTAAYDNAADRWVLTFLGSGAQVAVSDGPNPLTAGWFIYNISAINDYQKLSIWSDGYYMTDNTSSSNRVWALERDEMLAGNAGAQILGFDLPGIATSGFYSPQAFSVTDGNMPAAGGAPIVYMQDDAWSGVSTDHIKLWTIDVNWASPGSSTVSAATQINTTPFISVFDGGSFSNLTQPGGGSAIDALQATIMNQAQFRKFSSHNSAVFNFVVDADASAGELAAVRWQEFRQSGDNQPWSLYQEGTYTAPDGRHAWNASLAMDGQGNIGMGYSSMSGPSTPTTVRVSSYFTGRLSGDPINTMTASEEVISNGNQNFSGTRYGDYSKIDVDPTDDSTFWFITEYMNSGRKGVVGVFEIAAAGPPDTEDPTDPNNLVASNITGSGATLNWTASTDNVGVAFYNILIDGIQVGTTPTNSFNVSGLLPLTLYNATVNAQDAAGNTSGDASTSFTTIDGPPAEYCDSASTDTSDEFIGRVQLNTIDNASGAQFYSDFTAISTDLTEGQDYTVTVTPTWTGTVFAEGYAVWIDYNADADFDDTGELVWSKAASTDTPNSGIFTVPSGTSESPVRVRVSMKYNGIPSQCETFQYGEVEDYTINLMAAGGGPDIEAPSKPLNVVASNITDTTIDLSWDASTDNVGVVSYEVYQNGPFNLSTAGTSTTMSGLTPNTEYKYRVRAVDAAGNKSSLSKAIFATTTVGGGGGPGVIAGYYFETGLDGWTDGGSDCFRTNNASRAFEGSYSMRLRDGSATSFTESPVMDLTGNTEIAIEFHSYSISMDLGEFYVVEFFDGSTYQAIGTYERAVDFNNSSFFTDIITLDSGSYSFNANNRIRITNFASDNKDRVYLDAIVVSGDNVAPFANNAGSKIKSFTENAEKNINVYPNPTKSTLSIDMLDDTNYDSIVIFSTTGQIVKTISSRDSKITVDVSNYASGLYFIRFVSDKLAVTKRFVKD
ncbi:MAG: chitodextrinase [Flavobacteriaceae bacterium]|jgi:chitodextrinase|uniref:fibronectin type III domain-containing protein n=1 Tax=Candidatus Marifrigoribacter sp. Uisw_064 TaxID=3230970 RepID=UPI003ADB08E0